MVQYRRYKIQGGCYFFTVVLKDRKSNILIEQIDTLRKVIIRIKNTYPFTINAYVFLPDHLHMIWTLPLDNDDFSIRWNHIKGNFVHELNKKGVTLTKNHRREYNLWQPRFLGACD